ncbi:MAG TPA: DUF2863 family protein [Thiobacillaceae bacterium]|nr:DUF2863 family protein [Thiobacillaceae bacterium]HNU64336.1 DUF2863 family protein [Thiobacillaceae bacterium]
MKRRRTHARRRLSRDAERLTWLARGLADSGSRLEDVWWETELTTLIDRLLQQGDDETLNQVLDRLHDGHGQDTPHTRAYEELADLIEATCESQHGDGTTRLLITLPILAWSRYAIPSRNVPADILDRLRHQLRSHVLAAGTQVWFADFLFSPDQLPQGYSQTRAFANALWRAAAAGHDYAVPAVGLPESQAYVSDVRYIVATVEIPAAGPVFRWNEPDGNRDTALSAWREQGGPSLRNLLTGCAYELLLPDAHFAAWRRADQENRAFALQAAVAYLQALFNVPASQLRAVVAPYFGHWLEEWRIGFSLRDTEQVVHGATWSLLGQEDESQAIPARIESLLRAAGLTDIHVLDTRMPMEFCDDCGAPLFPNAEGENVHTELPEDLQDGPVRLH